MSKRANLNRRSLLKGTLAIAACQRVPFATSSLADEPTGALRASVVPSIDTHVYLGHWPHARLSGEDAGDFVTALHRAGVSQAWCGTFDGIFHKDISSANERLIDACAHQGKGLLVPFGSVNPTLPDWEEDVRRCHETFRMRGIRLHPAYHRYTLDDPRFTRLLRIATDAQLVVQIVTWLEDATHNWLSPPVDQFDAKLLPCRSSELCNVRLVISGATPEFLTQTWKTVSMMNRACFDTSRFVRADELQSAVTSKWGDRLVFGSGAPVHSIETASALLQAASLTPGQQKVVTKGAAANLLAH